MLKWCAKCETPILPVSFFGPDGEKVEFYAFTGKPGELTKHVTDCPGCGDYIRERSLLSRPRIAAVA